jgi:hypothetical protein
MAPVSDGRAPVAPNMMDASRRPTLDFSSPPQAQSTHTIIAETENPEKTNSRSRRATV